ADGQVLAVPGQRHRLLVDAGCEALVAPRLLLAAATPAAEGGARWAVAGLGLEELVGAIAGEEDPRAVRLEGLDGARRWRIAGGAAEELDLVVEGGPPGGGRGEAGPTRRAGGDLSIVQHLASRAFAAAHPAFASVGAPGPAPPGLAD